MEHLDITDPLQNESYINNITDNHDEEQEDTFLHILTVVTWIIISISLPLTLMALYLLVRNKHVLVYIINLLISGVIQLCCLIAIMSTEEEVTFIPIHIYWYAEIVSLNFMVCVAFERYLAIAHPLWYRFSRSVKICVVVCVVVWLLPIVYLVILVFVPDPHTHDISFGIIHLLPFPFFLFFLVGAVRALSAAIHLNSVEKRRIIGTLVLPILTYSLLFIPLIITLLGEEISEKGEEIGKNTTLTLVTFIFLFLSPLANVILYVFIRKGFMDKVLTSLCCKMDKNENSTVVTSTLNEVAEGQLAPKD